MISLQSQHAVCFLKIAIFTDRMVTYQGKIPGVTFHQVTNNRVVFISHFKIDNLCTSVRLKTIFFFLNKIRFTVI